MLRVLFLVFTGASDPGLPASPTHTVITLGALDTLGVSLAIPAWFDGRAAAKTSRDLYSD